VSLNNTKAASTNITHQTKQNKTNRHHNSTTQTNNATLPGAERAEFEKRILAQEKKTTEKKSSRNVTCRGELTKTLWDKTSNRCNSLSTA
jgi:hypothetical protein